MDANPFGGFVGCQPVVGLGAGADREPLGQARGELLGQAIERVVVE